MCELGLEAEGAREGKSDSHSGMIRTATFSGEGEAEIEHEEGDTIQMRQVRQIR